MATPEKKKRKADGKAKKPSVAATTSAKHSRFQFGGTTNIQRHTAARTRRNQARRDGRNGR